MYADQIIIGVFMHGAPDPRIASADCIHRIKHVHAHYVDVWGNSMPTRYKPSKLLGRSVYHRIILTISPEQLTIATAEQLNRMGFPINFQDRLGDI